MKLKAFFLASIIALFMLPAARSAHAGFDLGLTATDDGLKSFHLAVGDFYGVPERSIRTVSSRGIPDDELPVVFFLSSRAGVAPATILDLRIGGMGWMDISLRFGITGEAFYVPVNSGPPYGKAYGFYGKPKNKWKKMKFSDADVVNLVNLNFISTHYGYSPSDVMKMRDKGESFVQINTKAKGKGKAAGSKNKASGKNGGGENSSKGKGRKH